MTALLAGGTGSGRARTGGHVDRPGTTSSPVTPPGAGGRAGARVAARARGRLQRPARAAGRRRGLLLPGHDDQGGGLAGSVSCRRLRRRAGLCPRRAAGRRDALRGGLGAGRQPALGHASTTASRARWKRRWRRLGFASLVIARPSLLAGDRAALGQPQRPGERLALALTAPLAALIPKAWRPIEAATVARAHAARAGRSPARACASSSRRSCRSSGQT